LYIRGLVGGKLGRAYELFLSQQIQISPSLEFADMTPVAPYYNVALMKEILLTRHSIGVPGTL
jgi:hypothetical protein